jgi:transcriptional regulator with XRE-family HTH domain
MEDQPLISYLATYRRRTGLTQPEVAFLMGSMDARIVSRHECGDRLPTLTTVLKYAFVLDAHPAHLYEGLSADVQAQICKRARGLIRGLERQRVSRIRDRKLDVLRELVERAAGHGNNRDR